MKLLDQPYKEQLEKEIIQNIIADPAKLKRISLDETDFTSLFYRKVYKNILELWATGKEITLINLSVNIPVNEITFLFFGDDYFRITMADFYDAVARLKEETLKNKITQKIITCETSEEYFGFMDNLRGKSEPIEVEQFDDFMARYKENWERIIAKGGMASLLSPWSDFDAMAGVSHGDYVLVAARPSVGKTAFSLNLAVGYASFGQKVLFISVEMSRERIVDRILAIVNRIDSTKFKYANEDLEKAKREIEYLRGHFVLVSAPNFKATELQPLLAKVKPDVVFIDYIGLLKDEHLKGENENNRIGRISATLKASGIRNNCATIAACQLSRENEKAKRKPELHDLRDSGTLEQDADTVIMLHREDKAAKLADILVRKNRNGKTGELSMFFRPEWSRFSEEEIL